MSVESEILRIQHNIADAYAAVAEKGGQVPLQPNSENLAEAVASIPAGGEIYSTEETRIGTWIDGKPIYRAVVQSKTPNSSPGNVCNLPYISVGHLNIKICFKDSEGAIYPTAMYYSDQNYNWSVYVRNGILIMNTTQTKYRNRPISIVFEYTKTTD